MSRLRPLFALLLLACWLPATQHCGLEAAGLLPAAHADEAGPACCAEDGAAPCERDGCDLVESASYLKAGLSLKAPAPDLLLCARLFHLSPAPGTVRSEPAMPVVAAENPAGWVPVRHFARRAAPRSRAPSLPV